MMSESNPFHFDRLTQFLQQQGLLPSAAEVHGMLVGMLAGGADPVTEQNFGLLSDLLHEGQPLNPAVKQKLTALNDKIRTDLADPDMHFQLLLPDDSQPVEDRLTAMIGWVQAFLVGFGVFQTNLNGLSIDIREAIEDMVELAKLDVETSDDEETDRAYFEIVEYLRVSAIMCFCEIGEQIQVACKSEKTLH